MFNTMRANLAFAKKSDPAAKNKLIILLTYAGFHALCCHQIAHFFYRIKFRFLARLLSQISRFFTGIEIHPAAKISAGVFIDHGMGVVIGETAEVGKNVVIYQGVTLGGTGKDHGKRHPTIQNNVIISAGAKILGPITIGENCKIGAQAVVLKSIPPNCTAVGVPACIVKQNGIKVTCNNNGNNNELETIKKQLALLQIELQELKNNFFI